MNWCLAFFRANQLPVGGQEASFPLVDNDEVLVRSDIFRLLEESGVGVPAYYNKLDFTVNHKQGQYSRSRSGCYFCFYQQKNRMDLAVRAAPRPVCQSP